MRIAAAAASTLLLCTAASTVNADNSVARIGGKTLDLVLVRPLKAGKIVFGFVTFIPAGLFAESPSALWKDGWSSSETAQTWDFFVVEPFRETFLTPLGQVEY